MERFLIRTGTSQQVRTAQPRAQGESKMAPEPNKQNRRTRASSQPPLPAEREAGAEATTEEVIQGLNISCRTLAVEVAKLLAPDITASIEATISGALQNLQTDVARHDSHIIELEQRMSNMEDEMAGTQTMLQKVIGESG
ncbi:hypothetical protein GDO81_011456 [Engystomops pustulosus]|uniref:Uncharacterized protein n=1 Tax=Engystomops pustulosus TaxID=76066 RepID=A0AAV7BEC8_ENGPU|nr:hypothetical protein GDO81_011456 [Engystomops pustulosus]